MSQLMKSALIDFDFDCGIFEDEFVDGDDAMLLADFEIKEPERERDTKKRPATTTLVKSAKGWEVGAKVRRKALRRRGEIDNNGAVNSVQCRQALGRRNEPSAYQLFVFPTFDPSDALLFLPTTFAAYCNSANTIDLSKLILSHVTKNCAMNMYNLTDESISTNAFFKYHDLITQLFPDAIMCVHSTKVENNQIRASLLIKFTACKTIYDSVARMEKDAIFAPMFTYRDISMKRSISRAELPETEKSQFYARLETDLDLLVHARGEMILTIDESTKKVCGFAMRSRMTSVEPVDPTSSRGIDDNFNVCI